MRYNKNKIDKKQNKHILIFSMLGAVYNLKRHDSNNMQP